MPKVAKRAKNKDNARRSKKKISVLTQERVEYVDYNVGSFSSTGRAIRDDVFALVPGLSFRPTAGTVFKANYRRHWTRDLLGNPTARLGGYQVGVATYF